jgi:hypothetical protein
MLEATIRVRAQNARNGRRRSCRPDSITLAAHGDGPAPLMVESLGEANQESVKVAWNALEHGLISFASFESPRTMVNCTSTGR